MERHLRAPSLLDVLIDGFEKNEIMDGFHTRTLPMATEDLARSRFFALAEEATRWKGTPVRQDDRGPRRIAAWADLEIRQMGRGVMVNVRAPSFSWWHDPVTWDGDPMRLLYDWLGEERRARKVP